jgi:hypothetical protein
MVPVMSLWAPILVSAVIVFLVSALFHMVLPLHKNDVRRVPNEDAALEALRRLNIPPGEYVAPMPGPGEKMNSPAFIDRMKKGPLVIMNLAPGAPMSMGKPLGLWFVYLVVVSIFAAYIAGRALGPGAHYLQAFRFAGCTAFVGYSLALAQDSIWWRKSWTTTIKNMIDGLVYGLLTAGTFGWLWPRP